MIDRSEFRKSLKNTDWSDPDAGIFTNLCPDENRADFEFGSHFIVEEAKYTAKPGLDGLLDQEPSKALRDIEQIRAAIKRIGAGTRITLMVVGSPELAFERGLQAAEERIRSLSTRTRDEARHQLGQSAWAIWHYHGGSINDEDFLAYLERLSENLEWVTDEDTKNRVDLHRIARELNKASKTKQPPTWRLWEPDNDLPDSGS